MSKLKVIILTLVLLLLTNGTQFFIWNMSKAKLEERLTEEINTLNTTINALGPMQTVWTVNGTVEPGSEIKAEQLQEMSLPSSMITENYIASSSDIVGELYKIAVSNGTPLTNDMIMSRDIEDSTREVDICVDRWTVGLKAGDYVDYRITLPYGDDYIVIPHLRIESVGATTLKVYMTETQWHLYQGSLVDYYLHSQQGAAIYVSKYVEPGVQPSAVAYYAVPENVQAIMLKDPNIIDKAEARANENMRSSIDKILDQFKDETVTVETESALLNAGRTTYNSSVNSDSSIMETDTEEQTQEESEEPYGGDTVFGEEDVITSDGGETVE